MDFNMLNKEKKKKKKNDEAKKTKQKKNNKKQNKRLQPRTPNFFFNFQEVDEAQ